MSDFTLFIPSEIFSEILSHVNQRDCIECMTVCRRWYKLIPQHGKNLWKELKISGTSWLKFNSAMLECLGTHVEKVSIIWSQNIDKILQHLERQKCDIRSLEIQATLDFYTFDLDHATVFDGIGLFWKTLKELSIHGPCTQYFSLTTLLSLLPGLTHLTIKLTYLYGHIGSDYHKSVSDTIHRNIQSDNDDNDKIYNLVFLSLDSEFRRDFHIKEIVKRCPRLKYFMVSKYTTYEYLKESPIEFAHILQLCPSIRCIYWGKETVLDTIKKEWLTLSIREDTDNEDNNDYEKEGVNHLRQVGFYSNNKEHLIAAVTACLKQSSSLEQLHLSGYFRIDLFQLWHRFKQWNSNLLSHPSKLKSLELDRFHVPNLTENYTFSQDLFIYFQNIERLKLKFFIRPADGSVDEKQQYMRKVIEAIGHQLHQLRYLDLELAMYHKRFTTISLCDNLMTTLCYWNQKLEILRLRNVLISNDMLLDLCQHPNLHTLDLAGYRLINRLTEDGWILFARKLKEQEQNGYIPGRFQSILLSCSWRDDITDEVLEEFAGIKSLKTLRIAFNEKISNAGVSKFTGINSSISEKHKIIELDTCRQITLDDPHVIFIHPYF